MKKVLLFLVMISMCFVGLFAAEQQWEYMVVSFGKSYFSDYNIRALAYLDKGLSVSVQEAKGIEKSLDVLGQEGWEVVAITGTIGGDQQVTLKRPFDAKRTASDLAAAEKKQSDITKLAISLAEYLSENGEAEEGPRELIELDAVDLANQQKADTEKLSKEMQAKMETALAQAKVDNFTLKVTYNAKSDYYSTSIYLDATKTCLINGDSYRKSQVDKVAKDMEVIIKNLPFDKAKDNFFTVYIQITLDGVQNTVSTGNDYYHVNSYTGKASWNGYSVM
jgi:hypothetical protein